MSVTDTVPVGVVIERREIDNKWIDHTWRAVAVIAGAPPMKVTDEWRMLRRGEGRTHFHAGTLEIELHSKSTASYRANLANEIPYVFIVLQPGEEADEPEVMPKLATVCPDEAVGYMETGHQVDGVPMPPELIAWVEDFVDKHHVDVAFQKRKREPYDPSKGGFRARNPRGRADE